MRVVRQEWCVGVLIPGHLCHVAVHVMFMRCPAPHSMFSSAHSALVAGLQPRAEAPGARYEVVIPGRWSDFEHVRVSFGDRKSPWCV